MIILNPKTDWCVPQNESRSFNSLCKFTDGNYVIRLMHETRFLQVIINEYQFQSILNESITLLLDMIYIDYFEPLDAFTLSF